MPESRVEFDPVTLEILWSRLAAIVDEAGAALRRTSFSTIVREANDFASGLLDVRANSLAGSTLGIPIFNGTMPLTLRQCLRKFPLETWRPGDAVLTNDPWIATGHLHDFTLFAPVFHRGKVVAFAGNIAHVADVGGTMWAADAQDAFEEGLRVPPMRLMRAGELNQELAELIQANVRVPEQVMGDLHAQVVSAEVCARQVIDMLEEQAMEDLADLGDAIQDRAEAAMRRAVEAVPDGEYSYTLETDGFDEPITIRIKITVRGSDLHVDYAGTSPQIGRGLNTVYNYTYGYTTYPLKCILDPFTLRNEGSFRPFTVAAPLGCVLNPRYPAPVDGRQLTGHYLPAAVLGALAQAIPDRVIADSGGPPTRMTYTGVGLDGQRFSQVAFPWGGMGARPNKDGLSCTPFPANTTGGSFEVIESVSPLLITHREMIPDSGGPGRFRGGLGQEVVTKLISREPVRVSILSERLRHPPHGRRGGLPGFPAGIQLNDGDPIPDKGRTVLKPGDVVRLRFAGGGGYGPPGERERAQVLEDLENELITPESARRIYGVEVPDVEDD